MPFGDGTGPQGQGPQTGRARGNCSGSNSPGCTKPKFSKGHGGRRGLRNWFKATGLSGWQRANRNLPAWGQAQSNNSIEKEKQELKTELENLRNQAEKIEQRLQNLEASE